MQLGRTSPFSRWGNEQRLKEEDQNHTASLKAGTESQSRAASLPCCAMLCSSANPEPFQNAPRCPLRPLAVACVLFSFGSQPRGENVQWLTRWAGPQRLVTIPVKENTPLPTVPGQLFSVMFIPPAMALLYLENLSRVPAAVQAHSLRGWYCGHSEQGKIRVLSLACTAERGKWLPASGLQRAGLGREKGTGSGGKRVSTCLWVSPERETPLLGQEEAGATRTQVHLRDFTILKTSLLFKTRPNASTEVDWLFLYTAALILGLGCSRLPPSCSAAQRGGWPTNHTCELLLCHQQPTRVAY